MEIKRIASDQIRKIESDKIRKIKDDTAKTSSVLLDYLHLSDTAKTYSEAVSYAKNVDTADKIDTRKVDEIKRKVDEGYYTKNPEVIEEAVRSLIGDL